MKNFELFVGILRIWAFDMSLSLSIGMESIFTRNITKFRFAICILYKRIGHY